MDLLGYNIKITSDQMEQMTNRGAKVMLMVGVDQNGIMHATHTPDVDKDLLVKVLEGALKGFKENGIRTIIENAPKPGPKIFIK